MGFSRKRIGRDGQPRYTAYYLDVRDHERSAGTFATKKEANTAWQDAESKLREGRIGDPRRGRMTFRNYVEETWLPNHQVELSTRGNYIYSINKHIMPEFGEMRMIDIMPEHVRAWITKLQETAKRQSGKEKISAATIKYNKDVLSAIFTTAFNDQVIYLHPCRGVKVPPIPPTQFTIVTPEQFELIYRALPDADAQLLVETDIESGLRWGELTELRVKDIDFTTRIVTLSRVVVEVPANVRRDGERFVVKEYPKDRKSRRYKLSTQIIDKLRAHKDSETLGRDDLLFAIREQEDKKTTLRIAPNPDELGLTEPNEKGRQYKHGTMSGYGPGKCRCQYCRAACAIYRAERRAQGKDRPSKGGTRAVTTDGHIPNNWFRNHVWYEAIEAAELGFHVRPHDLRHAHASWLLAGGADLQVVKERLGHGSIATTERYLHTLPEADETALDALSSIRNRSAAK